MNKTDHKLLSADWKEDEGGLKNRLAVWEKYMVKGCHHLGYCKHPANGNTYGFI